MTVEGVVAVVAGIAAGSIALIGFGLDSAIEGIASVIIIWRFWGARALSEQAERRAQKLVAVSFFLLAPYVAIESVRALVTGHEAATSYLGIGLTVVSAALMPIFAVAKRRVGAELGSAATAAEGTQNMLCAYLSGRACRATRQHTLRRMVARPARGPLHRLRCGARGPRVVGRRGVRPLGRDASLLDRLLASLRPGGRDFERVWSGRWRTFPSTASASPPSRTSVIRARRRGGRAGARPRAVT